jgi:phosphatidylserine/phosphatidylglycerophosphate/cardiolipin synthase-like enzyme
MPFAVPFATLPDVVRAGPDVLVTLPDPPRTPGDPVVRPGVARLAGASLLMLPLAAAAATFELRAPVNGPCRRVELTAPLAGLPGVSTVIEVTPLPFGVRAVARRLPGLPVWYLAVPALGADPPDDAVVAAGEVLATPGLAWVGAAFDDRVTLSPGALVGLVAEAMSGLDGPADVTAWRALQGLDPSGRTLRVLDHAGRPAPAHRIRLSGASGTSVVTTDPTGVVPLPAGDLEARWVADGAGAVPAAPVAALYEASLADPDNLTSSAPPGEPILVPAGLVRGHLQVLDAAGWFADRPPGLDDRLGHVRPRSRLEPLVDGLATFRPLLADLTAATGPGCGAHFAGWAFNDFPLDPADAGATMFTDLVRALRQGGGPEAEAAGARFLMDKYLVFRADAPVDAIQRVAVLLLVAGVDALIVADLLGKLKTDEIGFFVLGVIAILAMLAIGLQADRVLSMLEDAIDQSEQLADEMNGIRTGIALRARHPARFHDNPLAVANPLPFEPRDFLESVSSWHQKFQVVRRTPDPLGNQVVGYLGGVDINQNRLDSPGHHGSAWRPADQVALSPAPSPRAFHDVHARITGPAAADVACTFERRWELDTLLQPTPGPGDPPLLGVAFVAPTADDPAVPPQPARHLVQVCRSGYAPDPAGGSRPLPWSPLGEPTIAEAVVKAIRSAREYIYIEDQYFTPHDAYLAALLDAAVREPALRLLVVMPSASDQVFGDIRHKEMFELLRAGRPGEQGYGERMVVAAPIRRPVLGDAGRAASRGRAILQEALSVAGDQVVLGPRSRLPKVGVFSPFTPFWLWVEGERMLAVEKRDELLSADGVPSRRFLVRRAGGAAPMWGATPRAHEVGAPVTLAHVPGIYVHTKVIVVDDVFVGIGSCNTNRRGFFHDGEIQAFAVPEQLKASRENPALALRTSLWAEHLGLPPAMGRALLADPVAAVELFRRSTYLGNRLSSFDALGARTDLAFLGEKVVWAETLASLGLAVADDVVPYVWNTFIEPTSLSEPEPRVPGPGL